MSVTSRIATPTSIATSPVAAQPLLEAVNKQLGLVPNMFRLLANSPAALEGYLGLSAALVKGYIDAKTRERIALAVAEANGCDYCEGSSRDAKAHAAVPCARRFLHP